MMKVLVIALASALVTTAAPPPPAPDPELPYDARFTFVRLRYTFSADPSFGMGNRQMRDPPWHHDYPDAERNLMHIITEVTSIAGYRDGGKIIDVGDPELFKYPIAYMSEPGFWSMNDQEAENMRNYLLKGGFLIFDDFGGSHWNNLATQMARLLPRARWIPMDVNHPIFHAFFDIDSLDDLMPSYRGQPSFFGLFEDNDPTKHMYAIANYNDDIGENWEYSETGLVPVEAENESYKFGINYIIYALTH
jgi:Domain of unknown function (DUF4159)